MSRIIVFVVLLISVVPTGTLAQVQFPLTEECETAIALSALPERLRPGASVYALVDGEYRQTRSGSGPFTCIIERNHRNSIAPQCMDEAGRDSVLPALIHKSQRLLAGATLEEVSSEFERKVDRGEFRPPARPGVSYMISEFNYIFVNSKKEVMKIRPHMMFYGPNLTNRDIGGSFSAALDNRGLPFIIGPSIHRNIISHVEKASDSKDVLDACEGQLGEVPPLFGI